MPTRFHATNEEVDEAEGWADVYGRTPAEMRQEAEAHEALQHFAQADAFRQAARRVEAY